jgi:hypothetical protein
MPVFINSPNIEASWRIRECNYFYESVNSEEEITEARLSQLVRIIISSS